MSALFRRPPSEPRMTLYRIRGSPVTRSGVRALVGLRDGFPWWHLVADDKGLPLDGGCHHLDPPRGWAPALASGASPSGAGHDGPGPDLASRKARKRRPVAAREPAPSVRHRAGCPDRRGTAESLPSERDATPSRHERRLLAPVPPSLRAPCTSRPGGAVWSVVPNRAAGRLMLARQRLDSESLHDPVESPRRWTLKASR